MLEGYYRNIFDRDEFINRPKDISYVIDELERRNDNEFQARLDLTNIGMGGYTALAVAGAEIDFLNLEQACQRYTANVVNRSQIASTALCLLPD